MWIAVGIADLEQNGGSVEAVVAANIAIVQTHVLFSIR